MGRHDSLQQLPAQLASPTHVKRLEQLCYLKVKGLIPLSLVKLGYLPLDFFHHLNLAFE